MRFVSWNVNGLRACMQKGFMDFFNTVNADFFCLQETKLQDGQIDIDLPGYEQYWNYAEKKGYSGTAIFTKHTPLSVAYGMGIPELDTEGRLITLEYPEFYLVTCYTPNAQRGLARIDHRLKWETAFRDYLSELDSKKPVILCGDLNVAHKEIDLKNPSSNRGNAGFSDEERDAFSKLLESGFTDSFRYLHPDTTGAYTWWSYMFNARQNNAGWRIDYFIVSDRIKQNIFSTPIYSDILGSDHCPVGLDLDISCNGSIWSSFENTESTPKTEEKGETKSSGVKAAAALICAALLLTGVYFLLPKKTPDPTPPATTGTTQPTEDTYLPPGSGYVRWTVYNKEPGYLTTAPSLNTLVFEINGFIEGDHIYELDKTTVPSRMNFWIRVFPMDLQEMAGCDLKATIEDVQHVDYGHPVTPAYCIVSKYRGDDGRYAGWFIYGYISRDSYVSLELSTNEFILQTANIPVSPIINANTATSTSTEELIDYAVHLRLTDELVKLESNQTPIETYFIKMLQYYPTLLELSLRYDTVDKLKLHGDYYPQCWRNANLLANLYDSLLERFTPYIDFTYHGSDFMSTQELVDKLMQQPQLEAFLTEYSTMLNSDRAVYQILRYLQSAVPRLEEQTDAAQVLLENYGKSPIIDFLIMQPEFLSKMSIQEADELFLKLRRSRPEDLATADLIHIITCIRDVRLSLLYNVPNPYENLRLKFLEIQTLERREGVIIQFLSYVITPDNFTEEQVATAKALLKTDYYYSKMTEAERMLLEHGPILYGDLLTLPLGDLPSGS